MDPVVWSQLPEDILARCVAMLPMDSRCRFSVAAKRWWSLLRSSKFKQLCSDMGRVCSVPVSALEFHPGSAREPCPADVLYLSQPMEVHRLELDKSLPDKFKLFHGALCCNVQDGLVFLYRPGAACNLPHARDRRAYFLCVLNPLTQRCVELPLQFTVGQYDHFTHRSAQVKSLPAGQFELTIVSSLDRLPRISMYSSLTARWKVVHLRGRAGQDLWKDRNYVIKGVFVFPDWPQYVACNGLLFLAEIRGNRVLLQAYSLDDGRLVKQLDMDSYPQGVHKILERDGRLLLVARNSLTPLSYSIWELNFDTFVWSQLSAVPPQLLLDLSVHKKLPGIPGMRSGPRMFLKEAVFAGRNLCLAILDLGASPFPNHIVAYNLETDTWSVVAGGLNHYRRPNAVFLFSPSLDVFP